MSQTRPCRVCKSILGACPACAGRGVLATTTGQELPCEGCGGTGKCVACNGVGAIPLKGLDRLLHMGKLRLAALSFLVFLVGGVGYCGFASQRYVPVARAEVAEFHRRFDGGSFEEIFAESDPAWSQAMDLATTRGFFSRIQRKMGSCQYSSPSISAINVSTNGTLVSMADQATCTNGTMGESFTWRIEEGRARLLGYHVNSPLLMSD